MDHALKFLNFLIDTGVPTTYTHSIRQFYPRSNIIMIPMDCVPSYSALNQLLICPWEKNIQGTKYLSSFLFDRGNIWSEQHDTWVFPPPFYVSHPQVLTTDLIEQGSSPPKHVYVIVYSCLQCSLKVLSRAQ